MPWRRLALLAGGVVTATVVITLITLITLISLISLVFLRMSTRAGEPRVQ